VGSQFIKLLLPTFSDTRGSLTVLENVLPFNIVRMYWIYGANGQTRGGHRHTYTRQALISLCGSVSVYMNDGVMKETINLTNPNQCLIVEPKDWHTMTFSQDSVLLVISSHPYNINEYIHTPYEDFLSD
jgi:dTDP-4-dehydrorhamnose 3,5-epimerase-like enzyme